MAILLLHNLVSFRGRLLIERYFPGLELITQVQFLALHECILGNPNVGAKTSFFFKMSNAT